MAFWSRILGFTTLVALVVTVFLASTADADIRAVSQPAILGGAGHEFGVTGTVDCGRRSGLRCEIGPLLVLNIWTYDISGSRERVSIDVSWIVQQLDAYDQDDLVCLNVQTTRSGALQAVGLSTPCGPPDPPKRSPVEKDHQTADSAPSTPTVTVTSTRPSTQTATATATATATPTITATATVTVTSTVTRTPTPTPVINLSLTKSGVVDFCSFGNCSTEWTITVTNSGPDIAHNVVVIDRPMNGLTTVTSAVVSQGAYNTVTNRWTIGTIGVGVGNQQTAIITFAQSPAGGSPVGYRNEAEVESADETDSNSTPNNSNPAEDDQDSDFLIEPD